MPGYKSTHCPHFMKHFLARTWRSTLGSPQTPNVNLRSDLVIVKCPAAAHNWNLVISLPSRGTRADRDYQEEMTSKWSLALNKWKSALTLRQLNTLARKQSTQSLIAVDDEGIKGKPKIPEEKWIHQIPRIDVMCHESQDPGERLREGANRIYFNFLNIQTKNSAYADKDIIMIKMKEKTGKYKLKVKVSQIMPETHIISMLSVNSQIRSQIC